MELIRNNTARAKEWWVCYTAAGSLICCIIFITVLLLLQTGEVCLVGFLPERVRVRVRVGVGKASWQKGWERPPGRKPSKLTSPPPLIVRPRPRTLRSAPYSWIHQPWLHQAQQPCLLLSQSHEQRQWVVMYRRAKLSLVYVFYLLYWSAVSLSLYGALIFY